MISWKMLYDKEHKPLSSDLKNYFSSKTMELFDQFIEQLNIKTGFHIQHTYTVKNGWIFKIGLKNIRVTNLIINDNSSFSVNGYCVKESKDVKKAIDIIIQLCDDEFKSKVEKFEEKRLKRNLAQIERTKKRKIYEKNEQSKFSHLINPEKINKYKWSPRISLSKLKRLYESSANMLLDSELLDEIGFTLYYRCLQGKEERELYYNNKLKCHNCGVILNYNKRGDFLQCECGYQYVPREYGRSYQNEWMPHGKAQPVFDGFIEKWPKCKTSSEKMNIIDWVIHECHKCIITGTKADSVAKNLLSGSREDAEKLILELAYGDVLMNK
jgi:ribosomal 50S subunit-recycling heat shock protein